MYKVTKICPVGAQMFMQNSGQTWEGNIPFSRLFYERI
jgi:hypothetical protein